MRDRAAMMASVTSSEEVRPVLGTLAVSSRDAPYPIRTQQEDVASGLHLPPSEL